MAEKAWSSQGWAESLKFVSLGRAYRIYLFVFRVYRAGFVGGVWVLRFWSEGSLRLVLRALEITQLQPWSGGRRSHPLFGAGRLVFGLSLGFGNLLV